MNQSFFNKYKSYTSKDFALDDDFVRYVCIHNPEDVVFWKEFLKYLPEKAHSIREAKLLILALQPDLALMQTIEIEDLWTSLSKNHDDLKSSEKRAEYESTRYIINKTIIGMVIGFAFFSTAGFWGKILRKDEIYEYHTGFDQVASIILPDSSEVKLNANSSIKLWSSGLLLKKEEILLDGEAYFRVKKNGSSSFFPKMLVHTNGGTVEVKGTIFNVYSRGHKTKVYLNEGRVKLTNLPDLPVILMNPGDYIQVDKADKTISKIKVAPEIIDSWIHQKIVFEKTPFYEVLDHIKEIHGVEYILGNKTLKDKLFTGVLPANDLNLLLKALEEAFDINIRYKEKKILISLK